MLTAEEQAVPVFLLAAGLRARLSANPRPGHQLSTAALHRGFAPAISDTATGFGVFLYDDGVGPRCTGKERDAETGLDYFGARYMSAAQGRFTGVDPKMFPHDLSDPQSWNKYGYSRNNPLRFTDPDGEDWKDTDQLGTGDLLNATKVLQRAEQFISEQ